MERLSARVSVLLTMASVVEIRQLKSLTREIKNIIGSNMESPDVPVMCAQALWLLGRCWCHQNAKENTKMVTELLSTILSSFVAVLERCYDALEQSKDRAKGVCCTPACIFT